MKKFLFAFGLSLGFLFLASAGASASNGQTTLQNTVGGPSVCHAESVFTPDQKYTVLIICSDLIYPPSSETLHYVVWANPSDAGDAIKLGDLGLGTAEFKTTKKLISLFVTQEQQDPKSVSKPGTVVMRGNLRAFDDLRITTGSPQDEQNIATPAPTPRASSSSSLISKLTGGALITVVSVIIIIVMLVLVKPFK